MNVMDEGVPETIRCDNGPELINRQDKVRNITWEWMLVYNEEHPHKSLGGLPPAAFREKVEAENYTLEMSC